MDLLFSEWSTFSEEFYVDGQLEGELKIININGQVLELTTYQNGMENGVSKKFSDEGILIEEVYYLDDKLHGKGKYFELSGDLKEEGEYQSGKRVMANGNFT